LRRDEGIGVRVIQALSADYSFPPNVHLVDGGTAGLRLSPVIESADHLIIIDAVQTGEPPGSIFVFTPETVPARLVPQLSLHELGPLEALALVKATGGKTPETVIIGVEPEDLSPWNDELTPTLQAALPNVVTRVLDQLARCGAKASRKFTQV